MIADAFLPLDGILLYQAARRQFGPRLATAPGYGHGASAAHVHGLVPLAERNRGPQWYYACSFAQWGDTAEGKAYWEKRFDTQYADMLDFEGKRGRVVVESGRYRSYHMPVFYRHALWVEWYAVGAQNAVAHLLQGVWAIGKKTVQGFGRVAAWQIEPWADDWSERRDGQPTRAIPISEGAGFDAGCALFCGYRPSYWLRENQALCEVPDGR
ncbi:MAG TPA: hypothetical protein PK406_00725 [Verrucomicrobiota bacterium]|nr:hypothetical protein [Verrucomicrobiota bacterium]